MSEEYFDFEERITSQLDIIRYVNLLDPDVLEMITTEYGSVEAYVKDYVARTNTMEHAYDLFVHLASCKGREQLLIIHRFGLIDGKPKTLEEVAKLFGITRERARQIERKCLNPTCTIHRTNSIRHYLKD